jgi:hypothetical protein
MKNPFQIHIGCSAGLEPACCGQIPIYTMMRREKWYAKLKGIKKLYKYPLCKMDDLY